MIKSGIMKLLITEELYDVFTDESKDIYTEVEHEMVQLEQTEVRIGSILLGLVSIVYNHKESFPRKIFYSLGLDRKLVRCCVKSYMRSRVNRDLSIIFKSSILHSRFLHTLECSTF